MYAKTILIALVAVYVKNNIKIIKILTFCINKHIIYKNAFVRFFIKVRTLPFDADLALVPESGWIFK